ncbi:MAG: OOP family OmpA-OmpF porin [Candidatus Azotimanducaceae bacterium]|jgi:OOP family OmpA-OmpF porin
MIRRILTATLLLTASVLHIPAMADEAEGVTTSFGLGVMGFDSDRQLDNTVLGNIGLGYRFASPWGIEFAYITADSETENGGVDVDSDHWRLDGLYHLETINKITPYFSFGVGRADFDTAGGENGESMLSAGVGAKYWFKEKTALRPEFKLFRTSDTSDTDAAFIVSLHHSFSDTRPVAAPEPAAPLDTDNDGVTDDVDACPRTPANASVDSSGCAIDSDGDTVPDYKDACPDTDLAGARIDSRGCYEILKETVSVELLVEFDYDSAKARPEHQAEARKVFNFMTEYPQTKVTVEGHTDSKGAEVYNQKLSQRRADTIANILVQDFNVSAERISAVGYGEAKPIGSNDTAEGRQTNRRVVGVVEANIETVNKIK